MITIACVTTCVIAITIMQVDYVTGVVDLFLREVFRMSTVINDISMMEVSNEQLIDICVLAGCDYCPSIPGIGFAKVVTFTHFAVTP